MNRNTFHSRLLIVMVLFLPVNIYTQEIDSIQLLIEQYKYKQVIDIIDSIADYEKNYELLSLKVKALKGLRRYEEAIPLLKIIYHQDTANAGHITDLANCYQLLGNLVLSRSYYYKALAITPGNDYLIQQIADSYYQSDDFELAKKYYLRVYSNDSTFHLARQIAKCYESLETLDSAQHYYSIALDFVPGDYESTYRLSNLYKLRKEYDKGIALSNSYLARDSTNRKMLRLSGFLHFMHKEYSISVKQFERCISLNDTSDFVFKYLGYSYFHTSEFELAKDYLEKAYLQDTLDVDLCYALGLACDYSVYKKLGIYYLNKTIDLLIPEPSYLSQVYQDLAHVYTGNYKYTEALGAYLAAYELTPADTMLIFNIASHYDNWLKDSRSALVYYEKFMETCPENREPLPKIPGTLVVSYYDFVERRINEIKEEIFWEE